MTNTVEESAGSEREAAEEEEDQRKAKVILTCTFRLILQLILPLTYKWIQVLRCSKLWLVYQQWYVPVCLGSDLLIRIGSFSLP